MSWSHGSNINAWNRPRSSDKLIGHFLGTRNKMFKHWGVIGGIAAAVAAGVYVLWGPIAEKQKRKRGMVPGLLNLGNTCFLNSLLQSLAACPSFVTWLEQFSKTSLSSEETTLSKTLFNLLKALSSEEPSEEDILDAGCLLDVLKLYRWHISSFEEQDAHELFHVLTSSLDDERDCKPKVNHLFDMQCLEFAPHKEENMACRSRAPLHPLPLTWKCQHPFHGRLTSNMSCKRCEHRSPLRYDSFDSLSLSIPLPHWGQPISLDQCLQHFISSETIKEVECENCTKIHQGKEYMFSQRTTFVKQLKLGKLPQCLCIHLQRLTWSSEGSPIKRQEHVQFSEYLIMDRYKHSTSQRTGAKKCSPRPFKTSSSEEELSEKPATNGVEKGHHNNNNPFSNGNCSALFHFSADVRPKINLKCDLSSAEYLFQLTAVLVHHGDMHSGHFITYRRSPASARSSSPISSQWLWISDDSVRKASLQEALSSNAYMLFYERVQKLTFDLQSRT